MLPTVDVDKEVGALDNLKMYQIVCIRPALNPVAAKLFDTQIFYVMPSIYFDSKNSMLGSII